MRKYTTTWCLHQSISRVVAVVGRSRGKKIRRDFPNNPFFRQGLPFLLNFRDRKARYYRHEQKNAAQVVVTNDLIQRQGLESMSIKRILFCILAVGAVLGSIESAHAQKFQPLINHDYFGHDMQFFAPAELGTFGGAPHPRIGWYGSLDRMYLWTSRAAQEVTFNQGDFTWGNRFDIGYMTQEDHGWHVSFMHLDGPNVFHVLRVDRVNRLNDADAPPTDGEPLIADQNLIEAAGPTGQFPRRFYDVKDSLNSADFSSFELNKVFRRKQLHNGGILEPFVGFRYMKFVDRTRNDVYQRFNATGDQTFSTGGGPPVAPLPAIPGAPPLISLPDTTGLIEQFSANKALFENNMFGGQMGMRVSVWKGSWNLSTEIRAFAMQNFQNLRNYTDTTITLYDSGATNAVVDQELSVETRTENHFDEFVYGAEVRAQAAYEVTRDVALQFGLEFVELGQGIGRGNQVFANTENVTMVGAVFGVYVRR